MLILYVPVNALTATSFSHPHSAKPIRNGIGWGVQDLCPPTRSPIGWECSHEPENQPSVYLAWQVKWGSGSDLLALISHSYAREWYPHSSPANQLPKANAAGSLIICGKPAWAHGWRFACRALREVHLPSALYSSSAGPGTNTCKLLLLPFL